MNYAFKLNSTQLKKTNEDVCDWTSTDGGPPWLEEEDKPRAAGCVYFSFPLHAPGKADVKLNDLEVVQPKVPALFIRGKWIDLGG